MQCEFCDKKGLAVLPVRPAVAPPGTSVPVAVPGMLRGASAIAHFAATAAVYTLRHLRTGFLYTYDESRKKLEAYAVVEGGYFYKLEPNEFTPLNLKFACAPEICGTVASCVTVPDAKNAGNVWFGFSDVHWTEAVRKKHENDPAYRARHMQCLDVKDWLAKKAAAGVLDIEQVNKVVAEYALSDAAGKAMAFTTEKFKSKAATTKALKERVPLISPAGGLLLSVADPVGVATDLGLLMQHSLQDFTNQKVRKRELALSSTISLVEEAVRQRALDAEEVAADKLADEMLSEPDLGMLFPVYRDKKLARVEDMRTVSEAEAKRAQDNAWARYQENFRYKEAGEWKKAFDAQMKEFDKTHIEPLARAHAAWMKSTIMAAKFECTHDATKAGVGAVYTKTLQMCIGSTQDKAACFDLYVDWFEGDVTKKENLLLRALTLNQDTTAKAISDGMAVSLDWRGFPLDAVFANVGKATERVAANEADAVGKLLVAVFGPVTKALGRAYDGKVRAGMVALSLYTQKPFVVVEVKGSKKAFRSMLIRELLKGNGQGVDQRKMERAVSAELRRLKLAGEKLEGTDKKKFLMMLDLELAGADTKGLSPTERANRLAARLTTPEQVEATNLSAWRAQVSDPTRGLVKGSIPFVAGAVGAALQFCALQKLMEDRDKAMAHEKDEALQRMAAGMMALGGTMGELFALGLSKLPLLSSRFGPSLVAKAEWLGLGGRVVGFIGAMVMAGWDFYHAYKENQKGNAGMAFLYGTSAIFGVGLAVAMWLGFTGFGLILLGILVVIAVAIEYFKNNKVQDWLERCLWGTAKNTERYKTLEEEMAEFKKATS